MIVMSTIVAILILCRLLLKHLEAQSKHPRGRIGVWMMRLWNRAYLPMVEWALSQLPRRSFENILDTGVGNGASTALLHSRLPRSRIIGIDISEKAIAEAGRNRTANVFFDVKDVEDTGYPGESFDLVCAFQTHFHWPYLENSLRELRRLMADDGLLIIACEQKKISYFLPRLEQDDDLRSWLIALDLNLTQTVRRAGWVAYLVEKFPRQSAPAAEKVSRELFLPARGFPDSRPR